MTHVSLLGLFPSTCCYFSLLIIWNAMLLNQCSLHQPTSECTTGISQQTQGVFSLVCFLQRWPISDINGCMPEEARQQYLKYSPCLQWSPCHTVTLSEPTLSLCPLSCLSPVHFYHPQCSAAKSSTVQLSAVWNTWADHRSAQPNTFSFHYCLMTNIYGVTILLSNQFWKRLCLWSSWEKKLRTSDKES